MNPRIGFGMFRNFTVRLALMVCGCWLCFVAGAGANPAVVSKDGKYWSATDNMEMVYVPAGESWQGSNTGSYDEKPLHRVTLAAFFIDVHEVTNAQFAKFIQATDYSPQGPWRRGYAVGEETLPVRLVTWHDAKAYAEWAGKRLPTEAEWEKAARGTRKAVYPWGNRWKPQALTTVNGAAPVGTNPLDISPYGCRDMGGNVWEWVSDWYDRYYYEAFANATAVNPQGPPDGAQPEERFVKSGTAAGNERSTRKVIKSGGWQPEFAQDNMRVARRMWANPNYWLSDTGFRCAVSATATKPK